MVSSCVPLSLSIAMRFPKLFVAICLLVWCLPIGLIDASVAASRSDAEIVRYRHTKRSVRSSFSLSDSLSNINFGSGDFRTSNNGGSSSSNNPSSSSILRSNKNLLFGKLSLSSTRIQQCREGCLEKFAIKEELCQQRPECSMSGFPPYNYNSLPDALHLLCWDECAKPPPPKINKSIRETWALRTVSMLQQDSLVLVDVAWSPLNTPNQCLVTWEVSGGGLMGNLLTESSSVQLSLWPDTKYRVQVTCKNKKTGAMSRSLPLTIDTIDAIPPQERIQHNSATSQESSPSVDPPLAQPPAQPSSAEENAGDLLFNHHTNFVFNWHNSNNDVTIDKIEPLNHPDIMTIAALSDMQKPLLFGVIAGTLLLAVILCLYICLLRTQRISSDKKALIDDNDNAAIPPVVGTANHFGVDPTSNSNMGGSGIICNSPIDPAIYSRTVHVLTV